MPDLIYLAKCVEAPSVAGEFRLGAFAGQSHLSKSRIRYLHQARGFARREFAQTLMRRRRKQGFAHSLELGTQLLGVFTDSDVYRWAIMSRYGNCFAHGENLLSRLIGTYGHFSVTITECMIGCKTFLVNEKLTRLHGIHTDWRFIKKYLTLSQLCVARVRAKEMQICTSYEHFRIHFAPHTESYSGDSAESLRCKSARSHA
jgi:hypothetical protein